MSNPSNMGHEEQPAGRLLLAFLLSFLVIFGYSYYYSKHVAPQKTELNAPQVVKTASTEGIQEKTLPQLPAHPKIETWPEEEQVILENDLVQAAFTSLRGAIRSLILKPKGLIRDEAVQIVDFQNPDVQPGALSRVGDFSQTALLQFKVVEKGNDFVVFEARKKKIIVRKKFTLRDNYAIELEIQFTNKGKKAYSFFRGYDLSTGSMKAKNPLEELRPVEVDYFLGGPQGAYLKKAVGKIKEREIQNLELAWIAIKSKYFALVTKPMETLGFALITETSEENFQPFYACGIRMSPFSLEPDETLNSKFFIFCGPKDINLLKSFGFHFESLLDFDGIFGSLSHGLLFSLRLLYSFFHNYGVAIIILTLLLKLLFYPLSAISLRSMKDMQALKPELDIIKKKHKDNPRKIQQETMALYKEHNIKPLAGCLPMVVQIPIFIAFYKILMVSIELRGANFLWIHDLARPDMLFNFGTFPVNILPILNGATMFWQQSLTPTDPSQKSLKYMMPAMITVFFYKLPSGLILYWLVTTLATVVQQFQVQKGKKDLIKGGIVIK